jgi:hypothetical protein
VVRLTRFFDFVISLLETATTYAAMLSSAMLV